MVKCHKCNVVKPSNEFPVKNAFDECEHGTHKSCYRCAIENLLHQKKQFIDNNDLKENDERIKNFKYKCPVENCNTHLNEDLTEDKLLDTFQRGLNSILAILEDVEYEEVQEGDEGTIRVMLMTGKMISLDKIFSSTKISEIAKKVSDKLKDSNIDISSNKIRLVYKQKELFTFIKSISGMKQATLKDHDVSVNATLHALIYLMSIPENLETCIFDIMWNMGDDAHHFLDASCIIFDENKTKIDHCDFDQDEIKNGDEVAIQHSGDQIDKRNKIGHHEIIVILKQIPKNIHYLFFTLTTWSTGGGDLENFKPKMGFYDKNNIFENLCETQLKHGESKNGIVLCGLSRSGDTWDILEYGNEVKGNTDSYEKITEDILKNILKDV